MKKKLSKSTDDLIRDIKVVISKDRCSLTEEEKKLFNECIKRLKASKKLYPDDEVKQKIELIDILMILMRFFETVSKVKDFFD